MGVECLRILDRCGIGAFRATEHARDRVVGSHLPPISTSRTAGIRRDLSGGRRFGVGSFGLHDRLQSGWFATSLWQSVGRYPPPHRIFQRKLTLSSSIDIRRLLEMATRWVYRPTYSRT